jgi:hypothetical protein
VRTGGLHAAARAVRFRMRAVNKQAQTARKAGESTRERVVAARQRIRRAAVAPIDAFDSEQSDTVAADSVRPSPMKIQVTGDPDELLPTRQAAAEFGLHPSTLWRWRKVYGLKVYGSPHKARWRRGDIHAVFVRDEEACAS